MITDLSENQFLRINCDGGPQVEFNLVEFDPIYHQPIGGVLQNIRLHDTGDKKVDKEVNTFRIRKTIANLRQMHKTIMYGYRYGMGGKKLSALIDTSKAYGFNNRFTNLEDRADGDSSAN